ncbi:MAG TPA: hypothetical protein VM076_07345 [Gemmatimonadaceae bacterium]|nr:hypothetical protein [Gemmatimonadaceae bacterium]
MLSPALRALAHAVSLSTLGATVALAQHPGQHPAQPDAAIVGTWSGKFQMQATGGMDLLVAHDTTWHVKMQLLVDHPFPPVDVRDFKVEGKNVTWINDLMGTPCKAKATIDDAGTMKGDMACDARTLTFSLTRKK